MSLLRRRAALLLSGLAMLAGGVAVACALGTDPPERGLGDSQVAVLHRRVAAVRHAARAGDRHGALVALAAFRRDVMRDLAAGEISRSDAASLLATAAQARRRLIAEVTGSAPTPASLTATAPPAAPPIAPATAAPIRKTPPHRSRPRRRARPHAPARHVSNRHGSRGGAPTAPGPVTTTQPTQPTAPPQSPGNDVTNSPTGGVQAPKTESGARL